MHFAAADAAGRSAFLREAMRTEQKMGKHLETVILGSYQPASCARGG